MLAHLLNIWKSNNGNLLLLLGAITAAVMSAVWYFNLIPTVEIIQETNLSSSIAPSVLKQDAPVFAVISTPPYEPSAQDGRLRGHVQIYRPDGFLDEGTLPVQSRLFELDENGFNALPINRGGLKRFAVLAFIDLNVNGRLDFDEKGLPNEPFRLSSPSEGDSDSVSLEAAAVAAEPSNSYVIHFEFADLEQP